MRQTALIWDLDGTLLDSYAIIVSSMQQALAEQGIQKEEEEIHRCVIAHSVGFFIQKVAKETGISADRIGQRYSQLDHGRDMEILPILHAPQILQRAAGKGCRHFVYTHKGAASGAILDRLGLSGFFTEVVTSQNGFAPKPSPEAIGYLVNKYRLQKEDTFYIGDRRIDVECAVNAGVKSILFLTPGGYGQATGKEDYVVSDLLEIEGILF